MLFKDGGSQQVRELIKSSTQQHKFLCFLLKQADRTNVVVASVAKALAKYLNYQKQLFQELWKFWVKKKKTKNRTLKFWNQGVQMFLPNPEIVWVLENWEKIIACSEMQKFLIINTKQDLSVKKTIEFFTWKNNFNCQMKIKRNKWKLGFQPNFGLLEKEGVSAKGSTSFLFQFFLFLQVFILPLREAFFGCFSSFCRVLRGSSLSATHRTC